MSQQTMPTTEGEFLRWLIQEQPTRPYTVYIADIQTVTEKNTGGHWSGKSRRAKLQRSLVYYTLLERLGRRCPVQPPCTVLLTRVAPRLLDSHDNLASAVSHCVDGVSDYLAGGYGHGEDRQPGLTWHYAQRQGPPRTYGVEIVLQAEGAARDGG